MFQAGVGGLFVLFFCYDCFGPQGLPHLRICEFLRKGQNMRKFISKGVRQKCDCHFGRLSIYYHSVVAGEFSMELHLKCIIGSILNYLAVIISIFL